MNMIQKHLALLICEAQVRLEKSNDPLHDAGHASRVATYAAGIARQMNIVDPIHTQALEISAWWHDVSRTITKKPSFVLMPLIDDTLSALMLAITIIKRRAFTRSAFLALRLVLSKSVATGKVFSRICLTKNMRTLLDILRDADTVDTLAAERTDVIHSMVDSSWISKHAYKTMIWWFATTAYMEVKTHAAKEYIVDVFQEFLAWVTQDHIRLWHIERYGEVWFDGVMKKLHFMLNNLHKELSSVSRI